MDETGVLCDALFIAVVAVDEDDKVSGLYGHFRALVVTGRGAYTTLGIAIDGQSGDVEHPSPDAFIGLALTTYTECQRIAHELIGIEKGVPMRWLMQVEDGQWRVANIFFEKDDNFDVLMNMRAYADDGKNDM